MTQAEIQAQAESLLEDLKAEGYDCSAVIAVVTELLGEVARQVAAQSSED